MLKKPKKITYAKAKRKAWDAFSKYIRLRDEVQGCFTCGVVKPYKQMQAGHWIPGRHNSILFDERGYHAQCYHCNIGLKGNPVVYYDRMLKDYGVEVCNELKRIDKIIIQYKVIDFLGIEQKYSDLVDTYGK